MSRTRKGSKGPGWEHLWGRFKSREDRQRAASEYVEPYVDPDAEGYSAELDLAWYCHMYGPCDGCLTMLAERGEADND